MFADDSEEGCLKGLGWIPGNVKSFASYTNNISLPLPHMGWNKLNFNCKSNILASDNNQNHEAYFLHSYYFQASSDKHVVATTNYNFDFHSIVSNGHIYGIQCHPEKSHHWGENLIKNFVTF